MLTRPQSIYINWSAYDELSDKVELTEELATRQLDELLRLKGRGVQFDYYLMDCFWYQPDSGYRAWRKPHWPAGPDRFLARCLEQGVKPGLWVATNNCGAFAGLAPHPAWEDSLNAGRYACCMFAGGFLNHFIASLDYWYERGVRLYKFDFCNLDAVTPRLQPRMLKSAIRHANAQALRTALIDFKQRRPDCLLLAYNGFDEGTQRTTAGPIVRQIDPVWLEAFDAIYCGDPRPADVPAMNFWRAKDIYSDHQTRLYELSGMPLAAIDNAGFMIGTTGTCYFRGKEAWKGMLLLSLARGGWANTYYGNLDLLTADDARFFATAQRLFYPLQQFGHTTTFGGIPGEGVPYGYMSQNADGHVITVANPGQQPATIDLPAPAERLLFADAGFVPQLVGARVTLGPEQMAVLGAGRFAAPAYDFGRQEDVIIPSASTPLPMASSARPDGSVTGECAAPAGATVRIVMRQTDRQGRAQRSTGGSPPTGTPLGQILTLAAQLTTSSGSHTLPLKTNYDKQIWSGLSWAVAETEPLSAAGTLTVTGRSSDRREAALSLAAYQVRYG